MVRKNTPKEANWPQKQLEFHQNFLHALALPDDPRPVQDQRKVILRRIPGHQNDRACMLLRIFGDEQAAILWQPEAQGGFWAAIAVAGQE